MLHRSMGGIFCLEPWTKTDRSPLSNLKLYRPTPKGLCGEGIAQSHHGGCHMETLNAQPAEQDNERYQEIIEHMNLCCLCGNELTYKHETDYVMLTVREEAHCHSCGIRTRKDSFTIQ